MLLKQFDSSKSAVINPEMLFQPIANFPETVISIFSAPLFHSIVTLLNGKTIAITNDVDGTWNVYEVHYHGYRFAMCKARLGAPACVGCFEDIIAMGAKRIILTGNCGVLDKQITDCGIIIPTAAIRDEGTSYHYVPAADYIEVNHNYRPLFKQILEQYGYSYIEGITWTTDAFYRETAGKIAMRKEMGAVCVEMECAAVQALCDFRGVEFFQYLYAGDNLDHSTWEPRSLSGDTMLEAKEKIALLAFELGRAIEEL